MLITVVYSVKTLGIRKSERHRLDTRRYFFILRTAMH